MSFPKNFLSRLACAAGLCAALAGCSTAPTQNLAGNSSANSATQNAATENTGSENATANSASAENVTFTNAPDNLSDTLKKHYVGFSFDYPSSWILSEAGQSANAANFVKVERNLPDHSKGDFSLESFAVGYFSPTGNAAKDATLFPQLAAQLSAQLQKGFPEYKKVAEGKTKIGDLNGYEFRFQSHFEKTARAPVAIWGRVVLLPQPNSQKGVVLTMLASSLAPEIKNAADVGEKGQLPVILKSFKFEK